MGLFRRKKGRHALGAAVTSIPSGPLQGFLPQPPLPAPAAPPPVILPAAEPDLMTSIAQLIATGEAWTVDAPVEELPRLLAPGDAAAHPPAVQTPPEPALAVSVPVTTLRVSPATNVVEPPPVESARSSLEAALSELLPPGAPEQPAVTPPAARRVQLGFRDGTTTTLEPGSDQALALEELAQSLTRRD